MMSTLWIIKPDDWLYRSSRLLKDAAIRAHLYHENSRLIENDQVAALLWKPPAINVFFAL